MRKKKVGSLNAVVILGVIWHDVYYFFLFLFGLGLRLRIQTL